MTLDEVRELVGGDTFAGIIVFWAVRQGGTFSACALELYTACWAKGLRMTTELVPYEVKRVTPLLEAMGITVERGVRNPKSEHGWVMAWTFAITPGGKADALRQEGMFADAA